MSVITEHFFGTNEPDYNNGEIGFNYYQFCHYCCFKMNEVIYTVVLFDNGNVLLSSIKNNTSLEYVINQELNILYNIRNVSKCLVKFEIYLTLLFKIIDTKQLNLHQLNFICPKGSIHENYLQELSDKNNHLNLKKNNYHFDSIVEYSDILYYSFINSQ